MNKKNNLPAKDMMESVNKIKEKIKLYTAHYKNMWKLFTYNEEAFYLENDKSEHCEMFKELSESKQDLVWDEIQRTLSVLSVLTKLI